MSDRAALKRDMEKLEARKTKLEAEISKTKDRSEAKLAEAEEHGAAAAQIEAAEAAKAAGKQPASGGAKRGRPPGGANGAAAKKPPTPAKPAAAVKPPPAAKPSPPARPPAPKPPPAAASADEDHEYGESTDHPGVKFTVPKQATLREAVVELAENEQLVYRLRDYRLRIVDQDYGKKDYHAILSRDAEQRLLGVIVWKDERSRRGIDVEIKILAVKGADTPNTVSQGTASDLISEMVGKLRNPSSQPVEASITGAINPRDKPMIGRWDQLGFIHSDETMSCARTIFTNC